MSDTKDRRRILLITRNFPPICGGMEKLNWHIANELGKQSEVRVIAPAGPIDENGPQHFEKKGITLTPLPRFLIEATFQAVLNSLSWRPDIVIAGSGLTAPIAWFCGRMRNAKILAYLHGLDLVVPHRLYQMIWPHFFRKLDGVLTNSKATQQLAERAGINTPLIRIVYPGTDIPTFDSNAGQQFKRRHGLEKGPLLLSVGRLTKRKGILDFIRFAFPLIIENHPECILLIVGDTPRQALFGTAITSEMIFAAAEQAGLSNHVRILSKLTDTELSAAYCAANLHVFPVRDIPDNPEGFGMVAIEAAAHGLETIAFATGGVPDAVKDEISGTLIPPGDYAAFAAAVDTRLKLAGTREVSDACRGFAANFTWHQFSQTLHTALASFTG